MAAVDTAETKDDFAGEQAGETKLPRDLFLTAKSWAQVLDEHRKKPDIAVKLAEWMLQTALEAKLKVDAKAVFARKDGCMTVEYRMRTVQEVAEASKRRQVLQAELGFDAVAFLMSDLEDKGRSPSLQ